MQTDGNITLTSKVRGGPAFYPFAPPDGSPAQRSPAVVFVATSRADGGIERYSVQMAAELGRCGTTPLFACRPGGQVEQACHNIGISTLPLSPRNSGDLRAAAQFAALLSAHVIDIVHVHSRRDFLPALLAVWLARRRRHSPVKLVLHAHMVRPLGAPPALSARLFARHADRIICVSDAVRDFLLHDGNLPPSKVCTLHNGVDTDKFAMPGTKRAQAWRSEFRRECGIAPDALVLVMIGRLDAKGQAALIEALPPLSARFPAFRVVLVGADGIAGERERQLSRAHALHVADRIIFTGPRDDVPRVLAASDILLHLPTDEAFGLALTEAMAAGLPTITARTGGCPEVVQDGRTGFVVPPDDPTALAATLETLLCGEQGAQRRLQMGRAGRAAAEALFLLPHQMNRLRDMYTVLCPDPLAR